ncbi:MAG: RagB/SusD family nutrient uptake outer membrane protein [Reichenbachiella sp.]
MKLSKIIAFVLVLSLISTVACKDEFLEIPATGSLTQVELSSLAGIEGAVIASYSQLLGRDGFYGDASNWFWGSVMGGDANKGSNAGDQSVMNEVQSYATLSTNGSVSEKYRILYEGVARANAALQLLANAQEDVSDADKIRLEGEAKFLRGHYYFGLKKMFNDVPYVDENWNEVDPVVNDVSLWPMIEADFLFAYQNLPATQGDAGRANSYAAGAYLAKAYLYQEKYTEALTIYNDVISNGTTAQGVAYDLVPSYRDAFRAPNDNNEEAVFSSQAAAGTGDVQNANAGMVLNMPHANGDATGQTNCCGFFQPSIDLVNSFRTDATGLPLLDGSYNSTTNMIVNDLGIAIDGAFTPDAGNIDPRLDHSVGRRGLPYLDWGLHPGIGWVRDQAYAGPYAPKKFVFYANATTVPEYDASSWTAGYTTVNVAVIRFADVLLMAAECEIAVGTLGNATALINRVRDRAANSFLRNSDDTADAANYVIGNYATFGNATDALIALKMERKLELSGEGHRFYDLKRWGDAATVLNAYLDHERQYLNSPFGGAVFEAGVDEFLPIPQAEIDLQNGVLIQNPGF